MDPNVNDVLSGRGGRINSHPGNVHFRALVHQHKHTYLSKLTKKLDKVKIASKIVSTIRTMDPPGRFLKEDTKTHHWIEIGDEKARKKAGQAMREKADETRKELEHTEFPVQQGQGNNNNWQQQQQGYPNVQNQNPYNFGQNQFGNNGGAGFQQQQQPSPGGYGGGAQTASRYEALSAANGNGQAQQFGNNHSNQLQHAASMPIPADSDRRRQHASILKGNAVAFDQEFHKLRNSDSSGSRVHSLATSGVSSMRDSSGSSLMSILSSGILSQNELLQLALLQQSGQMAPLDETLEWSDKWDQASLMASQELQRQSALMGGGGVPGNGVGNRNASGLQSAIQSATGTGGTSVHSGMTDSDRRRMFQQNRDQSHTYLPSDLKGSSNSNANPNFRASHLMNTSIDTLGSSVMGPPNMSSMGMGSTNMMSANAGNAQTNNVNDQRAAQLRVENMQNRLSGMGLDPLLVSDNSLMNMLAEAAANSDSLGSTFSFKSSMGQETFPGPAGALSTGSIPSESGSAVLLSHMNQGNNIHAPVASTSTAPDSTAAMGQQQHPTNITNINLDGHISGDGNLHQNAVPSAAPVASMSMQPSMQPPRDVQHYEGSERVLPAARGVQFHPTAHTGNNTNMHSMRGTFDPIALSASIEETSPSNDGVDFQKMKAPPQRGVSRAISGLSTKSDVSMEETSWYNEVRNLNSLRNLGDSANMDSRLRLFSEHSTRSLMSDLSENMSALDLTAFDTGSRRDLFGSITGRNSSQRGFGDANMGSSSRRDLGKNT